MDIRRWQFVIITLTVAAVAAVSLWTLLSTPFQRLTRPSVERNVALYNTQPRSCRVLVYQIDIFKVLCDVTISPGGHAHISLFSGHSLDSLAKAKYVIVVIFEESCFCWRVDGADLPSPEQYFYIKQHRIDGTR